MRLRGTLLAAAATLASIVGASSTAHAMGVYVTLDVVAWNEDGTAALMSRGDSSSGEAGYRLSYFIVDAATKVVTLFPFTDTVDPDKAAQKVTAKGCTGNVDKLQKALAAKHFTGIVLDKAQCKVAARSVVTLTPAAASRARPGIAVGSSPELTKAATAAETAAKAADANAKTNGVTVFAAAPNLAVVIWGENGDDSPAAHAAVYVAGKRIIEDLR